MKLALAQMKMEKEISENLNIVIWQKIVICSFFLKYS